MNNFGKLIGGLGAVASILLWIIFSFYNPYDSPDFEPIKHTFFLLFLPASFALIASITFKRWLMLLAFLWSFPLSLYFLMTPGIFLLFGVTCISYLISFLLITLPKRK